MDSTGTPPPPPEPLRAADAPTPEVDSYCRVRNRTESLAAPLGPEDQVVQSMPDASPTKWHRAHTTWFFEEFVLDALDGYGRFGDDYAYLFNSYYEAVGDRQPRPRRGLITRPTVDEVGDYRRSVDSAMTDALASGRLDHDLLERVELGLHHEQQHQELLLMDALHLLAQNPTRPAYGAGPALPAPGTDGASAPAGRAGLLEHDGGLVEVGRDASVAEGGFGYDNESPRHRRWLEPFAVEDRLVTCGEWVEFIEDGGYRRPELWLSDGWHTVVAMGWDSPLYWRRTESGWQRFALTGPVELDSDEPVAHVSYYEADAFARWRGARLPSEAEWEVVATGHRDQFFGHLWQWTSSAYSPYPGFTPAEGAVGEYNGKFMVDQQVLRGSSFATPPGHARTTYRNFFPSAARWAFNGVRIAHDANR